MNSGKIGADGWTDGRTKALKEVFADLKSNQMKLGFSAFPKRSRIRAEPNLTPGAEKDFGR